ncbi:MAG: hypothetical protein GY750_17580 [Lentisphaerae bacterium]|nr:hypothetical protein [Lentisphaerota bacterium]MCP4103210.1 hypothetical protein [Lentisphaerota bacterium]
MNSKESHANLEKLENQYYNNPNAITVYVKISTTLERGLPERDLPMLLEAISKTATRDLVLDENIRVEACKPYAVYIRRISDSMKGKFRWLLNDTIRFR